MCSAVNFFVLNEFNGFIYEKGNDVNIKNAVKSFNKK